MRPQVAEQVIPVVVDAVYAAPLPRTLAERNAAQCRVARRVAPFFGGDLLAAVEAVAPVYAHAVAAVAAVRSTGPVGEPARTHVHIFAD